MALPGQNAAHDFLFGREEHLCDKHWYFSSEQRVPTPLRRRMTNLFLPVFLLPPWVLAFSYIRYVVYRLLVIFWSVLRSCPCILLFFCSSAGLAGCFFCPLFCLCLIRFFFRLVFECLWRLPVRAHNIWRIIGVSQTCVPSCLPVVFLAYLL